MIEEKQPEKEFILLKKRKKSTKKKSEFYVDPEDFTRRLQLFYDTEDDTGENFKILGEYFYKIACGLASSGSFVSYSWKPDMISAALEKMVKALRNKKFDLSRESSAFSYYTQCAYWAFIHIIKTEKKHHETIKNYRETKYPELLKESGVDNIYIRPENDGEIFDDYD